MAPFPIREDGGEQIRYNYPSYSAFIGRGLLSFCPNYRFPGHWHDDVELSVIIRGSMDYNVNGQIQTVREGDGFFIAPRQFHLHYSENHTECEYICVLVHPLMFAINSDLQKEFLSPLLNGRGLPFYKFTADVSWHRKICEEIRSIYREKEDRAAPLLLHSHFCKIWAGMYQHLKLTESPATSEEDLAVVKAMIQMIQESYQNRIMLSEIAAAGAVGQSKCCRLFKAYLNMTPNDYLTQYRLDKSRALLQETEMPVTRIAEEVGFGSASYYTKVFREWYGETPTEYRSRPRG